MRAGVRPNWHAAGSRRRPRRTPTDPDWVTWLAKACRHAASPAAAIAFLQVQYASDVRSVLPLVQAPTLILSRAEDDHDRSADLAERIPGARHVRVPGKDRIPYAGNVDALLDEVERFIQSVSASQAVFDRVLATVLFTDIVGSTQKADELGDRDWRALLERHNQVVRAMVGRYRGTEVDTAGDGFLATFDGPARAVRCAQRSSARSCPSACRSAPDCTPVRLNVPKTMCTGSPYTSAHVSVRLRLRRRSSCHDGQRLRRRVGAEVRGRR